MIVWNEKQYDEQQLSIVAAFHLDRFRTLSRLIDKQTEIFNDARISLEAMIALRDKSDAALRLEFSAMEALTAPPFD